MFDPTDGCPRCGTLTAVHDPECTYLADQKRDTEGEHLAERERAVGAEPMSNEALAEILWDARKIALGYDPTAPGLATRSREQRDLYLRFAAEAATAVDQVRAAELEQLRNQIRILADDWEPAPHSAPEDRWDRGHDAAGRQIAKQLRALIEGERRG